VGERMIGLHLQRGLKISHSVGKAAASEAVDSELNLLLDALLVDRLWIDSQCVTSVVIGSCVWEIDSRPHILERSSSSLAL
jgi:hypothetical protein